MKHHDLIAPYRQLDSTQQSPMFIYPSSIWYQGGGMLPEYVLYTDSIVCIKGKRYMQHVCQVDEARLERVSGLDLVTQSIGMNKSQHEIVKGHMYHNAKLVGPDSVDKAAFSSGLVKRLARMNKTPHEVHLVAEIVVTSTRVEVSRVIDLVAKTLVQGALQLSAASLSAAPDPGSVSFFQEFGTPSATALELNAVNPKLGARLLSVTHELRDRQDLISALHGHDETSATLALMNIFVQRFACKVTPTFITRGSPSHTVARGFVLSSPVPGSLSALMTGKAGGYTSAV